MKDCRCVTLGFLQLFAQRLHDLTSPPAGGVERPPRGPRLKGLGRGHMARGPGLTSPGPPRDHSSLQLCHLGDGRAGSARAGEEGFGGLASGDRGVWGRCRGWRPRLASWCPGLPAEVLGTRGSAATALQTCCCDPRRGVPSCAVRPGPRPPGAGGDR